MKYILTIGLMLFSTTAVAGEWEEYFPAGAKVEYTVDTDKSGYSWACYELQGQRYMVAWGKFINGITAVKKCPVETKPDEVPMD